MRKLTLLLLALCALVLVAQAETWHLGTVDADSASTKTVSTIASFYSQSASDDELVWEQDYASPNAESILVAASKTGLTFDMAGYTTTLSGSTSYWLRFHGGDGYTVKNGTITGARTSGIIGLTSPDSGTTVCDDCALTALTITSTGPSIYAQYSAGLAMRGCAINPSTIGLYCVTGVSGLAVDDCAFAGGTDGIDLTSCASAVIDSSRFTDQSTEAIYVISGGDVLVTACAFDSPMAGVWFKDATSGFNLVEGCTFVHMDPYGIVVEEDGDSLRIRTNVFGEYEEDNTHSILLGSDGGGDVGTTMDVQVSGNLFPKSAVGDTLTLTNVHDLVIKCIGPKVFNNKAYLVRPFAPQGAYRNYTFCYLKGGREVDVYDNEIDVPYMAAFRLGVQGTTGDKLYELRNNVVRPPTAYFLAFADDSLVHPSNGGAISHSYAAVATCYSDDQASEFEADTLTAYAASNFSDEATWQVRRAIGGFPGLTGIALTPQGLAPIGVQSAQKAAIVADPVIGSGTPGLRTPHEALDLLLTIGVSGVRLKYSVRTLADLGASEYWLHGYPADGTGTWAEEFKGVLEVVGGAN